jgi:predicted SAM-dependent methyltransferase
MADLLKLNLGSGKNPKPGYINVDKFGEPDVLHDLEKFPWPWETNSVGEVVLNHVLEHLGETTAVYFGIIKELYRVCAPGARISITVPHPRHNDFLNDPTHVRIVTPEGLQLFSKASNAEWAARGFANSPLGLYLDVDFQVENVNYALDEAWFTQLTKNQITQSEISQAMSRYNNVVKSIHITVRVIKVS